MSDNVIYRKIDSGTKYSAPLNSDEGSSAQADLMRPAASMQQSAYIDSGNINKAWDHMQAQGKARRADISMNIVNLPFAGNYPEISADNPLNLMLAVESEVTGEKKTAEAYAVINDIIKAARSKIKDDLSPQEKMRTLFTILRDDFGITFSPMGLLSDALSGGKRLLDCDTTSMVFISVGHELNWPIHIADVPNHSFVFWVLPGNKYLAFETIDGRINHKYENKSFSELADYIVSKHYDCLLAYVLCNRASVYIKKGMNEKAVIDLSRAIALYPFLSIAFCNRANALSALGRNSEAESDYTRAVELNPTCEPYLYNRGTFYMDRIRYDLAEADLKAAIRLKSDHAEAHCNLGIIYLRQNKLDKAKKYFIEAIRCDRSLATAWESLGSVHFAKKNYEAAINNMTEAIRLAPKNPDCYYNRGIVYLYMPNKIREAIADFTEAINLKDDYALAYGQRSNCYAEVGDKERMDRDAAEYHRLTGK